MYQPVITETDAAAIKRVIDEAEDGDTVVVNYRTNGGVRKTKVGEAVENEHVRHRMGVAFDDGKEWTIRPKRDIHNTSLTLESVELETDRYSDPVVVRNLRHCSSVGRVEEEDGEWVVYCDGGMSYLISTAEEWGATVVDRSEGPYYSHEPRWFRIAVDSSNASKSRGADDGR